MRPAAHLAAAVEILDEWRVGDVSADRLLAQWGRAHRFAGSKDRVAIADRVYSALRRRTSAVWCMGDVETGRALILGTLALEDGLSGAGITALLDSGGPHAPAALSPTEAAALAGPPRAGAPPWVEGDYPSWLHEPLIRALGAEAAGTMAAMKMRAPLDLRVNRLKGDRDQARARLAADGIAAEPCPFAPDGLRLTPGTPVSRTGAYRDGLVEIQDEGAQLASRLAGAAPGMMVIDLAAGAGGKSLALAAEMENRGRILATDIDARRLAELGPRAERAGVGIIETRVLSDSDEGTGLRDLEARADLVLLDAPCSGSGTWRREPEAKWRLTPDRLAALVARQIRLLRRAAELVRPGGRLVYVTCSLLDEENEGPVHALRQARPDFIPIPPERLLVEAGLDAMSVLTPAGLHGASGLGLRPARTGTDGFFVAALSRG